MRTGCSCVKARKHTERDITAHGMPQPRIKIFFQSSTRSAVLCQAPHALRWLAHTSWTAVAVMSSSARAVLRRCGHYVEGMVMRPSVPNSRRGHRMLCSAARANSPPFTMWSPEDAKRGMVADSEFALAHAAIANENVGKWVHIVQEELASDARQRADDPDHVTDPAILEAVEAVAHLKRLHRYVFRRHAQGCLDDAALPLVSSAHVVRYMVDGGSPVPGAVDAGRVGGDATVIVRFPAGPEPEEGFERACVTLQAESETIRPDGLVEQLDKAWRVLTGRRPKAPPSVLHATGTILFQQSQYHAQEGFDKVLVQGSEVLDEAVAVLSELLLTPLPPAQVTEVLAASCLTWPCMSSGVDVVRAPLAEHVATSQGWDVDAAWR